MILEKNDRGDLVKAWQRFVGATPDGHFGDNTVKATKSFQAENNLREDGKVGVNTLAVAKSKGFGGAEQLPDTGAYTVLPESGTGFVGYNRERGGADQYGTAWTIAAIIELAGLWFEICPGVPVQIGDISRRGGGAFPPHSSHRNGRDFDVRPIRRDGKLLPCTIKDANYDQARTEMFVRLVRRKFPQATIYFNDRNLINKGLTERCPGHENHLHFRLK
jgi:hypothetical protein